MTDSGPGVRRCVECGSAKFYARERCNACYVRLRKALRRKGQFELRLIHGRPLERLLARIVPSPSGCLLYTGTLNSRGYGQISVDGALMLAHRAMYELMVGPIPDGLALDHLCHNRDPNCMGGPTCLHRRCVNVEHLEPVTREENSRRGKGGARNAAKTHCPAGHPYDEANTHVYKGAVTAGPATGLSREPADRARGVPCGCGCTAHPFGDAGHVGGALRGRNAREPGGSLEISPQPL